MIQKFLLVGDLHVQLNNLEDTQIIFDTIRSLVAERNIDHVVYLGDIYHTHSVMRQEVVKIVRDNIKSTKGTNQAQPIVLVGNHDLIGPTNNSANALTLTLSGEATVIDKPYSASGFYTFMPFTPDNNEFISKCNELGGEFLFCHQTFDGSRFENGFYAPGGVDQNKISQKLIISGHIHKAQTLGKVIYVGTPRPISSAEYNDVKGLNILSIGTDDGDIYNMETIPLNGKVRTNLRIDIHEEADDIYGDLQMISVINEVTPKHIVSYHIHGKKDFCVSKSEKINSMWKTHSALAQLKIVMDIKPSSKSRMVLEQGTFTIDDLLKKYIYEVSGIPSDMKDKVWQKITQV